MRLIQKYLCFFFMIGLHFSTNCTDPNACNFNPDAINEDGSCYYPIDNCEIDDCCPPEGFGFNNQQHILYINIESAHKFETDLPLDEYEDWIGGFKIHDETQNDACTSISEDCPDVNFDGLLTDDAEVCVGSRYWNISDFGYGGVTLYGNDGDGADGYLENSLNDQIYFKLYDHTLDNIFFMTPYNNDVECSIICGENEINSCSQNEIDCNASINPQNSIYINSLKAICEQPNYPIDQDNDTIPDVCDECPNDFYNDIDNDGICGNLDECPEDFYNDTDGDGICYSLDFCPDDFYNDIDNDGICGNLDECPNDFYNDADGDGVCGDIDQCEGFDDNIDSDDDDIADGCDQCPNDFYNDADGDGVCGDIDQCEGFDDNIDSDDDDIADGCDQCPNDFYNDADGDGICGNEDDCPFDPNNDYDQDGICDDVDDCIGDYDECGVCNGDGVADQECDCDGNVLDECGVCGGSGLDDDEDGICDDVDDCVGNVYDECGVCNGDGVADQECDCDGNVLDECGVCGGSGLDEDEDGICDDVDDCVGDYDECGVCNGDGISDQECDCDGNVLDECGVCGGSGLDEDEDGICDDVDDCVGEYDECGVCNGDSSSCMNNFNSNIPSDFYLSFSYPNPFNPETTFDYGVPKYEKIEIKIFNSNGKIVETPVNYHHSPGNYTFKWNAKNYSSGVYYFQLISNNIIITRKATLLK